MNHANLGSVSRGTLLPFDLIGIFGEALDALCDPKDQRDHWRLVGEAKEVTQWGDVPTIDEQQTLLSDLFDALNEYAPPFAYFGAHEGDGSDFGFWVSTDAIESAVSDGELLSVSDLSEVPDSWSGMVYHVNDHGNGTLYTPRREWSEVWAVV